MIIDSVIRDCAVMLLVMFVGFFGVGVYGVYKAVHAEPVAMVGVPQSVTVSWGDTLWSIAREYYPGQHTGKVVELIRDLNPDVDAGALQVGQWIDLPQEV